MYFKRGNNMEIFLIFLFLPISVAGIILSALKIKNKTLKILGIVGSSIVTAILLLLAIMVIVFWFDDGSNDYTEPSSQYVAQVENITDNEDGTFTYDDGEISLTFEEITQEEMENKIAEAAAVVQSSSDEVKNDIAEAPSVLKGESCGNEWTVVSDEEDVPKTVYVNSGNTTVSVTVNNYPKDSGKEYTASVAAALVTDKKPYSENKSENKYRTDSASFYIEEAHCLLYYPAQLSYYSDKDGSYIFRDKKSSATLNVTLSPNKYTSMTEVEGFIKNTENNLVLAYGPNWFTSESKKDGKVTFGYSGFGSEFIVDAELTYPENISGIYEDLTKLIKCRFVGDGIWKSKPSKVGYSKDRSTAYSDKLSREIAAYYSKEYGVILLYPELFSQVEKEDGMIYFTDPVTGAQIIFLADPDCLSLDDWAEAYGFDESYIDGERRVKASYLDGGSYAVMYLTDNENVCAILNYPTEYAWVYEEFEQEFTIVTSSSEIRNVEMQTVFIEEYGALITMPLQFTETSFYDGVIRYEDALNGMEMAVSFDYLTSETERKNLFACFNVVADDDNIFVGDSYVRWLSNQGFFYGARGKDMKALMQIDSPNVERAYESTLPMFSVEFVTEESKEVTKAQTIAQEATGIAAMSDPPEETSVSNAETSSPSDKHDETTVSGASDASAAQPNKVLVYENDADHAYMTADAEYWFSYEKENIEAYSDDEGWYDDYDCYTVQKDIVVNIIRILKYNHYDIDYYGARFMSIDDIDEYDEYWMFYHLIRDIDQRMYEYHIGEVVLDSDLGKGIPSVFEILCEILEIEKPDYLHNVPGFEYQTTGSNENYDPDLELLLKYISMFEGNWYDASADLFIEIRSDGSWSLFEIKPGDPNAVEIDRGMFTDYDAGSNTYYAYSSINDGVSYKMVMFEDGVVIWNESVFYRNDPANMGNEYYSWNDELYQNCISTYEGIWYYDEDPSADTFIIIDGDGYWGFYERTPENPDGELIDHGILIYAKEGASIYYGVSLVNEGVRYRMFEFDYTIINWGDDGAFYKM